LDPARPASLIYPGLGYELEILSPEDEIAESLVSAGKKDPDGEKPKVNSQRRGFHERR
jgi:hypothetical protein